MVGDAVDPCGAEVALESSDHFRCRGVEFSADRTAVAISGERLLQIANAVADHAEFEAFTAHDRRRSYPMADARIGERMPGKLLPGIFLAMGCDVGMRQHPVRGHVAAEHDPPA